MKLVNKNLSLIAGLVILFFCFHEIKDYDLGFSSGFIQLLAAITSGVIVGKFSQKNTQDVIQSNIEQNKKLRECYEFDKKIEYWDRCTRIYSEVMAELKGSIPEFNKYNLENVLSSKSFETANIKSIIKKNLIKFWFLVHEEWCLEQRKRIEKEVYENWLVMLKKNLQAPIISQSFWWLVQDGQLDRDFVIYFVKIHYKDVGFSLGFYERNKVKKFSAVLKEELPEILAEIDALSKYNL